MEVVTIVMLALGAFLLGACPFSVIVGRLFLRKDIRDYGDGNPGAANVFRAGGTRIGYFAVLLDIAKGVPFVLLAHFTYDLSNMAVVLIGLCAVLGHAFSPFLGFHGGKAIAVTFGVLVAMPQHEAFYAFTVLVIIGALLIDNDSWGMMLGASGTLAFLAVTGQSGWELIFMLCILAIFTIKQFSELRSMPGFKGRLIRWLTR
jgi:glycerol-3-phosphate acyltransferase PlsY